MESIEALNILVAVFDDVDALLLIFVRILGVFMTLPLISGQNIWNMARLFFAFVFAVIIYLSGIASTSFYLDSTLGYVYILLIEFLCGVLIGYAAYLVFNLILFTGQIFDFNIGLAMVNVLDPMTQIQVPIFGNLYYFTMMVMLAITGGINTLLEGVIQSYVYLPIGTSWIIGNGELIMFLVHLLVESLILALRISMPIFGTMLLINIALGIMVKTVPAMNVFVVGLPVRLMVGFWIMVAVVAPFMGDAFRMIFNLAVYGMEGVIVGLRPR